MPVAPHRSPGSADRRPRPDAGSVTVELPEQLDAEVEMTTVNGSLSADYPLTHQGRISPRRIRATIGQGGRRMEFKTVNGDVRLVKRS